jgi:hypothetical protein
MLGLRSSGVITPKKTLFYTTQDLKLWKLARWVYEYSWGDSADSQTVIAANEQIDIYVTLQNPLAFDLEIADFSLM